MPIKEQCNNCRYHIDNNCTQLAPSFDGTSCGVYVKRINLVKNENDSESLSATQPVATGDNQDITSGCLDDDIEVPSDEDIHGWLLFFLIVFVGLGSIWSIVELFGLNLGDESIWISIYTVVTVLCYVSTGVFTIIAFKKRDSDAVILAKTYIIIRFALSILALASDDLTSRETSQTISSIFWCVIWFIFLYCSKQVKRQIPIRKSKTRDWILGGAVILLPLALLGIGIAKENKSHSEIEIEAMSNLTLSPNQYSDGRIVITLPNGVDCDESMAENTKVFSISDPETGAEVTIVSDYDNEITKKNFNQYWRGWKSDELNGLEYDVVKDDKQTNENITVFYKLVRIKVDNPVDWEFALVFDHKTGKVCLVSGYSSAEGDSPVAYIINNLEFL